MLLAGLTGGLACGKSFVANAFSFLGCNVVEADQLGHAAMRSDGECYRPVIEAFGEEILGADGEIDRRALAARVFPDPQQLRKLNAIVHPAVRLRSRRAFEQIAERDPKGITIYVAAILVEVGAARDFQKLIVVDCTREQQIERSTARGANEADVRARLQRQLPSDRKVPWADFVIDASGSKEETLRQTKMVYDRLREIAI